MMTTTNIMYKVEMTKRRKSSSDIQIDDKLQNMVVEKERSGKSKLPKFMPEACSNRRCGEKLQLAAAGTTHKEEDGVDDKLQKMVVEKEDGVDDKLQNVVEEGDYGFQYHRILCAQCA